MNPTKPLDRWNRRDRRLGDGTRKARRATRRDCVGVKVGVILISARKTAGAEENPFGKQIQTIAGVGDVGRGCDEQKKKEQSKGANAETSKQKAVLTRPVSLCDWPASLANTAFIG